MFSLKTKKIYGLILLVILIELLTINIAFAYNETQSAYGLGRVATCKDLNELIAEAKTNEQTSEAEIYQKLFSAQCEGGNEEDFFKAPVDTNKKPNDQDKTCLDIQEIIIATLLQKETPDAQLVSTYSSECLESKEEETSSTEGGFVPIRLSAPLPIEGGEQIENSNKSYLFTYMVKLYRFVLGIAGIAAVIELILAGFQIALAADDTSGVENGKKRIIQTLEGLGILFCSAIILNTINPVAYNFEEEVVILNVQGYSLPANYIQESYIRPDGTYNNNIASNATYNSTVAIKGLQPELSALLDMFASVESLGCGGTENGYNIKGGCGTFDSYKKHPGGGVAGRYQFKEKTWEGIMKARKDITDFSPAAQDAGALYLMHQYCEKVDEYILSGKVDFAEVTRKLGLQWSSMPGTKFNGEAEVRTTVKELEAEYKRRLAYYKNGGNKNTVNSNVENTNNTNKSTGNANSLPLTDLCNERNNNPKKGQVQVDLLIKGGENTKPMLIHCSDNGKNDSLIFGDSIALGTALNYEASLELAQGGLSLAGAVENNGLLSLIPQGRKFKKVIISIGTNFNTAPSDKLNILRKSLLAEGGRVIWIQPGQKAPNGRKDIADFANKYGDKIVDLHPYMNYGKDKYHPTANGGYKAVAKLID